MDDNGAGAGNGGNDTYAAKLAAEVQQLKLDKSALQQELASNSMLSSEDDVETVRECFKPHVPQAIATMIMLAEAAESESVRMSASKYIIEYGRKNAGNDDEFRAFLNKLKVAPSKEGAK